MGTSITHRSELLNFLSTLGVKPKKGLSQNFLVDANIVKKILLEADVQKGDVVLEIGPGPGALTEALVKKGAKVFAVEKDRVFAEALHRFVGVEVFNADICSFDLARLPPKSKVISNLPYHLTAPILALLVPRVELFTTITVMVQEEVARRMIAIPKTKEYGSFTVFLRFYTQPHYAFKVSRHCFYPQPKVDSAVMTLRLKEKPPINEEIFFNLVHSVFQHRRKMVKTVLGEKVGIILEQLGENPKARPEDLPLETFVKLALAYSLKNS